MPAITNVFRRGAVYYWRRRLPAGQLPLVKCSTFTCSLATKEQSRARPIADFVNARFVLLLQSSMRFTVTDEEINQLLQASIVEATAVLDRMAAESIFDPESIAAGGLEMLERVEAKALGLRVARGENAKFDASFDRRLVEQGYSAEERELIQDRLNDFDNEPPEKLFRDEALEFLAQAGIEATPRNVSLVLSTKLKAWASAYRFSDRRYGDDFEDDDLLARNVLKSLASKSIAAVTAIAPVAPFPRRGLAQSPIELPPAAANDPIAPLAAIAPVAAFSKSAPAQISVEPPPQTLSTPIVAPTGNTSAEFVPGSADEPITPSPAAEADPIAPLQAPATVGAHPIISLGEGTIESRKRWKGKTAKQAASTYDLLARFLAELGVHALVDLRQSHLSKFKKFLEAMPKNYGKSPADFICTCAELVERGKANSPEKSGLSGTTINRHFSFITALINFVNAETDEAENLHPRLDPKAVRCDLEDRARDKRAAFDEKDIDLLFRLPPFTGCAGWTRTAAFQSGDCTFQRALYWAPLLFYYTGARREEICGLETKDVVESPIPHIAIRPNETRGLKTGSSERLLPIHSELLRLGFLAYVGEVKRLGYELVFPDLKSPTSTAPLGDRLYDELVPALNKVSEEAAGGRRVIHSLRHSCGALLKKAGVRSELRADILGHGGGNATEEIYAEATELEEKAAILAHLPVATAHLEPATIRLLPWVQGRDKPPFSQPTRTKAARAAAVVAAKNSKIG